jgi:hypothetical protein
VLIKGGRLSILRSSLWRREGVKLNILILATMGPKGLVREIIICFI